MDVFISPTWSGHRSACFFQLRLPHQRSRCRLAGGPAVTQGVVRVQSASVCSTFILFVSTSVPSERPGELSLLPKAASLQMYHQVTDEPSTDGSHTHRHTHTFLCAATQS